jgi:hypothetical protein
MLHKILLNKINDWHFSMRVGESARTNKKNESQMKCVPQVRGFT